MSARYIQIADVLRAEAIHMMRKGEKRLPTESEIATRFAVSRQTVRNALELLEEEGLIERIQGSGSYIKEIVRKSSASGQIAIITTFIDDYIFPSILHDAQHIFSSNGYTILLYATGNSVRRESEILRRLCLNRNQVTDMRQLLLDLWGDDTFFNQRSLHVFITKLRHKLSKDERIRIVNVRGIGYKLIDN